MVRAVEICGAEPGKYEVELHERKDEIYRLSIEAGDESLDTKLHAREDRDRQYNFVLSIDPKKKTVDLMWLDRNGKPQRYLDQNSW